MKPLKESVSVISAKVELDEVKAEKFELTENYEEQLGEVKQSRYIEKIVANCQQEMSEYTPVEASEVNQYVTGLASKAQSNGFIKERELLLFIMSAWMTEKYYPDWLSQQLAQLRGEGSYLEISERLFEAACQLTGMEI